MMAVCAVVIEQTSILLIKICNNLRFFIFLLYAMYWVYCQMREFDAEWLFWQELHRKREEKRRENERMAEEEMVMLKESGKVGRPRKGNVVRKKTRAKVTREGSSSDGETEQRKISTGGSRTCNIDDMFQVR